MVVTRGLVSVLGIGRSRYWFTKPFALVADRKSADLKLLKIAQQRFKEVKESIVMRFSGDGKSDITIVVWDFGGQKVRHMCRGDDKGMFILLESGYEGPVSRLNDDRFLFLSFACVITLTAFATRTLPPSNIGVPRYA